MYHDCVCMICLSKEVGTTYYKPLTYPGQCVRRAQGAMSARSSACLPVRVTCVHESCKCVCVCVCDILWHPVQKRQIPVTTPLAHPRLGNTMWLLPSSHVRPWQRCHHHTSASPDTRCFLGTRLEGLIPPSHVGHGSAATTAQYQSG